MSIEIKTSPLETCLTIVFLNNSHQDPEPIVWVCENRAAFDQGLKDLKEKNWIKIIHSGDSHIHKAT